MGLFDRLMGNTPPDGGMSADYGEWEGKLAAASYQNSVLNDWLDKGAFTPEVFNAVDRNIRFVIEGNAVLARYGEYGMCAIGKDTKPLEAIGYRFEVQHYRQYWNEEDGELGLMRPQQSIYHVPVGVTYVYKARPSDKEGVEVNPEDPQHAEEIRGGYLYSHHALDTQPEPQGGMTTVHVYAPSGHWAEGTALCDDIDNYTNVVGRTYALFRALEALNEVRGV